MWMEGTTEPQRANGSQPEPREDLVRRFEGLVLAYHLADMIYAAARLAGVIYSRCLHALCTEWRPWSTEPIGSTSCQRHLQLRCTSSREPCGDDMRKPSVVS